MGKQLDGSEMHDRHVGVRMTPSLYNRVLALSLASRTPVSVLMRNAIRKEIERSAGILFEGKSLTN